MDLADGQYIITADAVIVAGLMPEMREYARLGIESFQSATIGADPDAMAEIFLEIQHIVITEALGVGVVFIEPELIGRLIKEIPPAAVGPDPHIAHGIPVKRVDRIVAEAVVVYFVVQIDTKFARRAIEYVQPAIVRADPQIAIVV